MVETVKESDLLALLIDSNDLDKIKNRFNEFNIFESLGMVRQEIKHSNTIASIFDSYSGIGLTDEVFKRFIRSIYEKNDIFNGAIDRFKFELAEYDDLEVLREYKNIDLLVKSKKNKHIFIIENKVDAQESEHQLEKYKKIVEDEYKEYEKLYVFLSPNGVEASDSELWFTATYQDLIDAIACFLSSNNDLSGDKKLFLQHYIQMVRRHILEDEQLVELALRIYQKHKRALDYIYENKPDMVKLLSDEIWRSIETDQDIMNEFVLDHSTKNFLRIADKSWDSLSSFLSGDGDWTQSKRVLLWEIVIRDSFIALKLVLGPSSNQDYREKLKLRLQSSIENSNKSSSKKFTQIKTFFRIKVDLTEDGLDDLEPLVRKVLEKVKKHLFDADLKRKIHDALDVA